jgi:D-glycerate 3-kinase
MQSTVQVIQQEISNILQTNTKRPLIIAISGPQGSGKSFASSQLPYPCISLDDLYLSADDIAANSIRNGRINELLKYRGLPGTHNLELGLETLKNLLNQRETLLPRYDKSVNNGRGDPLPKSQWPTCQPPFNVIIIEGWCLGFKPLSKVPPIDFARYSVQFNMSDVEIINNNLKMFTELYQLFDYFIQIKTNTIENVYEWRFQQEQAMIRQRGSGMSKSEVHDFVSRFMVCYHLYMDEMDNGVLERGKNMQIWIDFDRKPEKIVYI